MKTVKTMKWIMVAAVALAMASCRTQRQAVWEGSDMVAMLDSHRARATRLQAKARLDINAAGQKLDVGGTLRLQRDSVVQLSIVPMGLVEAGVLEFTPQRVLVVNRIGKQYAEVAYDRFPLLAHNGLDFGAVQALFWGEVFAPDRTVCTSDDFRTERSGQTAVLSSTTGRDVMVRFVTSVATGLLGQTQVTGADAAYTGPTLNWMYSNHAQVGGGSLPMQHGIRVDNADSPASLRITLSGLKIDPEWNRDIRTRVDASRYRPVDVEKLLNQILIQ